jgi:hypothetical protein
MPSHPPPSVDGHVYAWGSGLSGQLGNGLQESRGEPTRMVVEGGKPLKAFVARGGEYVSFPLPAYFWCERRVVKCRTDTTLRFYPTQAICTRVVPMVAVSWDSSMRK